MARLASVVPRNQRLTVLGGLFIVAGSAVAYGDTGFPFFSMEFAALLGLAALAALILAVPFAFRPGGRAAVFAIGFTYFLDVAYVGGGLGAGAAITLLAGYLVYLIAWRKSTTIVPFATTAVAVSVALIVPQQLLTTAHDAPAAIELAQAGPTTGKPAYVHIILDEMAPLSMMPQSPFYHSLRQRMSEDYRRRGFDLFQDTVATTGETIASIGQVFANRDGEMHNFRHTNDEFTVAIGENSAASKFMGSGYALTMLQSSYFEICPEQGARCLTYNLTGDATALALRVENPAYTFGYALRSTGLRLLVNNTNRASAYYRAFARIAGSLGMAVSSLQRDFSRPPLVVSMMEKATPALARLKEGDAVFMHLLLPHYPYLLDEHCLVKAPDQVMAPRWIARQTGQNFDRAATERAYWEQAACTHDQLMAMIDAILDSPAGKDAVIVVHGDHGSRLFAKLVNESASETVRRHTLLTHFAVRGLRGRHDDLAAHHTLRQRVSIVLNAVLGDNSLEPALVTSATH